MWKLISTLSTKLIFKKFNVTVTLLHFEIGHFVAESVKERIKRRWHHEVESNSQILTLACTSLILLGLILFSVPFQNVLMSLKMNFTVVKIQTFR